LYDDDPDVVVCHGAEWRRATTTSVLNLPGVKKVQYRQWAVKDMFGEKIILVLI
jgi:hypothetical protein